MAGFEVGRGDAVGAVGAVGGIVRVDAVAEAVADGNVDVELDIGFDVETVTDDLSDDTSMLPLVQAEVMATKDMPDTRTVLRIVK